MSTINVSNANLWLALLSCYIAPVSSFSFMKLFIINGELRENLPCRTPLTRFPNTVLFFKLLWVHAIYAQLRRV